MQAAAKKLGLDVQPIGYAGTPASWQEAAQVIGRNRPDALFQLDCTTMPFQAIVDFALEHRIPTMSPHSFWPRSGGFVAYGPDLSDMARRAAAYVDKILKGAKPADLPVELPTKFELIVNLKTAKALGLSVPQSFLVRADDVIR